ncbi:MAG: L-fucose mutarotase [Clostridia bacterium]|nr:L-fucose mutarotase [Clostridia bacterium]
MLRGISPLISPQLLKILSEMGHGDEIVLADAHFPAMGLGPQVVRADGLDIPRLLEAILALMPLDQYDPDHFALMEVVPGDPVVPVIWDTYREILQKAEPETEPQFVERFAYYERAKKAYCIVATGEVAQYANVILKKGVVK